VLWHFQKLHDSRGAAMILACLAGPFTADTPWGIERNIRAAEDAAELILKARDDVSLIVPHMMGRNFVGRAGTPEYWYTATMRQMEACSELVLLPAWQASKGSRDEFRRACGIKLRIYASPDDFALVRQMTITEVTDVLKGLAP
jgi:hypothetical protein